MNENITGFETFNDGCYWDIRMAFICNGHEYTLIDAGSLRGWGTSESPSFHIGVVRGTNLLKEWVFSDPQEVEKVVPERLIRLVNEVCSFLESYPDKTEFVIASSTEDTDDDWACFCSKRKEFSEFLKENMTISINNKTTM